MPRFCNVRHFFTRSRIVPAVMLFVGLSFLLSLSRPSPTVAAQPITQPSELITSDTSNSDNSTLRDLEGEFAKECEHHEDFLERMDDRLEKDASILAGAAVFVLGGVLTWISFKTRRDIDKYFKDNVHTELKKALENFRKTSKASLAEEIAKTEKEQQAAIQKTTTDRDQAIARMKADLDAFLQMEAQVVSIASECVIVLSIYGEVKKIEAFKGWLALLTPLMDDIMSRLKRLYQQHPSNRMLAVQRARFDCEYRDNLDAAISHLKFSLRAREEIRSSPQLGMLRPCPEDEDEATLWYNLACYLNLKFKTSIAATVVGQTQDLRGDAKKALDKSITIQPANLEVASNDDDVKDLVAPKAGPSIS